MIELLGAGRTNREVADQLIISLATVKDHNHNIWTTPGFGPLVTLARLARRYAGGLNDTAHEAAAERVLPRRRRIP